MVQTTSYETAMQWARELGLAPAVAHAWFPEAKFTSAQKSENSLSLTRDGEGSYGIGLGPNPWINPAWQKFSLPKDFPREQTDHFTLQGQWAAYSIAPQAIAHLKPIEILPGERDFEIENFLKAHAPESSVFPGNQEIHWWCAILSEANEIQGVAAITQWESGAYLLSSVAVDSALRQAGIGTKLMESVIASAFNHGISELILAVFSKNIAARRLYEKSGFTLLGDFNYFER